MCTAPKVKCNVKGDITSTVCCHRYTNIGVNNCVSADQYLSGCLQRSDEQKGHDTQIQAAEIPALLSTD